jgi:transposase-like protein
MPLSGTVEVDETYMGGLAEGKRGRGADHKALVVIAAEEAGKGMGRIRMARVADASARSLEGFVQSAVMPGSRIHTDGWDGYAGLPVLAWATHMRCPCCEAWIPRPRPNCCRGFIGWLRC